MDRNDQCGSVHTGLLVRRRWPRFARPPVWETTTRKQWHNLISKPQLHSYVTGHFGIKSENLTHPEGWLFGIKLPIKPILWIFLPNHLISGKWFSVEQQLRSLISYPRACQTKPPCMHRYTSIRFPPAAQSMHAGHASVHAMGDPEPKSCTLP